MLHEILTCCHLYNQSLSVSSCQKIAEMNKRTFLETDVLDDLLGHKSFSTFSAGNILTDMDWPLY